MINPSKEPRLRHGHSPTVSLLVYRFMVKSPLLRILGPMHPSPKLKLKWHRLILATLATIIVADTAPHPQLAPGLLQTVTIWTQTHLISEH